MVDFTREDCMYELDGNRWTVNYDMAVFRKLTKNAVRRIISLHERRHEINKMAKQEPISSEQTDLFRKVLTGFEFRLQRLWGFPLDDRCHPHQRIGI